MRYRGEVWVVCLYCESIRQCTWKPGAIYLPKRDRWIYGTMVAYCNTCGKEAGWEGIKK